MDIKQAINDRRSIRAFTKEPVTQEILQEVLTLATRAVSAVNAQPWEFAVAAGDVLEAIRQDNITSYDHSLPPDIPDIMVDGIYRERSREIGKALFAAMSIERGDKVRRNEWGQRGFRFFDAPAVIILSMDRTLDNTTFRLDMGCVIQNICTAAMEYGLGTCVEHQAVMYQETLRRNLHIPENKRIVCGIAIGYPDWTFPANQVISTRVPVDEITDWYGF
mgnify:FL=1